MKDAILIDGEMYDSETGELINEVEQVEAEIVENTLPAIICNGGTHIKTNTEQLKRELSIYLEKYDVEVTESTEKDCAKMATELNKLAGNLDKKRKETASIIKKPADDLKIAIDELILIVQEKRIKILNGVDVFKQKRFSYIRELLKDKIKELYEEHKVDDKYQVCDIEPLVVEGSLAKTNLSKSANESLLALVMRVKNIQDSVIIREMQLELKCSNAGLVTPIELNEVQHIIEDTDYDKKLDAMIEQRIKIQQQMKERLEQEENRKQEILKQQEIKKQNEILENEKRLADIKAKEEEDKKQKQKEAGKKIIKIKAYFEVEVAADLDDSIVFNKFNKALKEQYPATFKQLTFE